jgi:lysine 2,3-aminomutase
MNSLRGFTSGYAVPQYVIDAPGGGGKVPINPAWTLSHNAERIVFRNFEGKVFEYPETADGTPSQGQAEIAVEAAGFKD